MCPLLRRIACCIALTGVLWGCETPAEAPQKEETGTPVSNLLRTAAAESQSTFDYPAAVGYYQSLYTRDPDDAEALLGLARNLRYIGSSDQAATLLAENMPKHPDLVALRAEYGKALVASGQAVEAVSSLTETHRQAPDDWKVLSALGIAYILLDDPAKAQESYLAALAISPSNASVLNNLALSMALSGSIDEGIELLERKAVGPSATPHIRQNLALMYAMKGDIVTPRRLAKQDLPEEMVANNVAYYERLYSRLVGVQEPPPEGGAAAAAAVAAVDVARLDAPAAEPLAPVVAETTAGERASAAAIGDPEGDIAQTPIEGIKVQLGVFPNFDRAVAGLTGLRDTHVDLLSGLRFEIADVEGADAPVGFMVLAGPLASEAMAADLCTKLHSRKEVCRLVTP